MADQELVDLKKWLNKVAYFRMQINKTEKHLEQIQLELTQLRRIAHARNETVPFDTIYQIDIQRVMNGEDLRTTLMIKNIPKRFTSEMLITKIHKHILRGTYDFIYLPLNAKNKCNLGYAFINMTRTIHVVQLYKAFHGKSLGKLQPTKTAAVTYARYQGKDDLIERYKYSKIKNQEKCFHPILFTNTGDQEPFPFGPN